MTLTSKKIMLSTVATVMLLLGLSTGFSYVSAADYSNPCSGAEINISGDANCAGNGQTQINRTVQNVINVFSVIVGIVSVIMIMVGGFKYVTSSGDSSSIASAKNTILFAIVGIIVAVSAQLIVRFVLSKST